MWCVRIRSCDFMIRMLNLQAASEAEESVTDEQSQSGEATTNTSDDVTKEATPGKEDEPITSEKIVTDIINDVIDEVIPADQATERQPAEGCEGL